VPDNESGTPAPRDPETITRIKRDATRRLLAIPNVVAVGIGPKMIGDAATGEPAIKVFVRAKLPAELVPAGELIPPRIEGVLTDVEIGGDEIPITAPVDEPGVFGIAAQPFDDTTQRPVQGGYQLTSVGSAGHGTLGCLLWDPANHEVGYALTNMHVVQPPDIASVTKNVTKLGQPAGDDSSSKCCNDVIGLFAGGGKSADRDEALVKLSPAMKWQAKIVGIGLVAGKHTLIQADVTGTPYKVAKRGQRSKLTGGTISAMQATTGAGEADNLIIIKPNPNTSAGTQTVFFAIEGDSGSALVNGANEVVALVKSRDDAGNAYAFHIDHVLKRLKDTDGVTAEVATATSDTDVHTVPGGTFVEVPPEVAERVAADPAERSAFTGSGGRAPLNAPWFSDVVPSPRTVAAVLDDLAGSESGRLLLALWRARGAEVRALVGGNRHVTIMWHRGGGAALMQLMLRLPADPRRELPATLNGEPLMACVDRLAAVLGREGTPGLRADLARARAVLPDLSGMTYARLVAVLGAAPSAAKELIVDA
jgi:hypothetical protein